MKLAQATGWDPQIIAELTGANGFNLGAADFKNEVRLLHLQECARLIKRLGVSAQQLFTWASLNADFAALQRGAQDIKKTVQAKYDEATWLTVAKPLNDKLRERQRDALVAYLLPRMNLTDSKQLFEVFLIDPEMSACMETSRVKQALSSVQLFVQRSLMNLEKDVTPSAMDAEQWEWRKHYRAWEANRKVFLWPENWIEPELRDDKSPFFKELESELLQNDLTTDTAETAFLNYLEKLDQVARLEIIGMYWQDSDPDTGEAVNILHVFGRTFHTPHNYYYRRLLNGAVWTPWEKVPADIQGDHLIPVIWNRRLYIFWPIFTQKADPSTQPDRGPLITEAHLGDLQSAAAPPQKHWEISLAWSEFKQNKWVPKQVAKQVLTLAPESSFGLDANDKSSRNLYVFRTAVLEDANGALQDLLIRCELNFVRTVFLPSGAFTYDLVTLGTFDVGGCTGETVSVDNQIHYFGSFSYDPTPVGADFDAMMFAENQNPEQSVLAMGGRNGQKALTFLNHTPTRYRLLYPHQYQPYTVQAPFFYQDARRTFFVTPNEGDIPLANPNAINLTSYALRTNKVVKSSAGGAATVFAVDRGADVLNLPITALPSLVADAQPAPGLATALPMSAGATNDWAAMVSASRYNWSTRLNNAGGGRLIRTTFLRFDTFYHPFVCEFMKSLTRQGIPALLTEANQRLPKNAPLSFANEYQPTTRLVNGPYPVEDVNFDPGSAYSLYNWELFFHAPLLIATRLSKNQRFKDAVRWFHYIFNPTDDTPDEAPPARYWKVLPFKSTMRERIDDMMRRLNADDANLLSQVDDWQHHPFQPHRIARTRLIAYQKNVFMKYVDNLIAWGDQLFRQDTIESINEAEQLYVLAADLLGPRPQRLPSRGKVAPEIYANLKGKLDAFSNVLEEFENEFPFSGGVSSDPMSESGGLLGMGRTLYFCIPQNDKLLSYWDTVADRLFKIRNCMNIEGVVRQLRLFELPIDPALLVQAAAQGVDLGSVLSDFNAPLPNYRFSYMLQKALEMCAECRSLGASLLSTLEKKDAEELALLRATHETNILTMMEAVKKQQVDEANTQIDALMKSRNGAVQRYQYYQILLNAALPTIPDVGNDIQLAQIPTQPSTVEGGTRLLQEEKHELELSHSARNWQWLASAMETLSSVSFYIPTTTIDAHPFGEGVDVMFGGATIGPALAAAAKYLQDLSAGDAYEASHAGKMAGYFRRQQEWSLQSNLAASEIMQIDKQIAAANIRAAIAQQDLTVHRQQMQNAQVVQDFMSSKFTSQDLYAWMMADISATYFQCYQLAYDLAKKAERAFRFERGLTESDFVRFGYWDSLRKGLLAGERLYLALKQLERAYHDQNKREYELTKHVSLVLHDPLALIALKETGQCEVELPEPLFDIDYPGHYMRRIKSVSLTIPCVVGPYTSVNCTLTLLKNKTRTSNLLASQYAEDIDNGDDRFVTNFTAIQSIATSHAQNDSGMFELNFRDERYLPFEGAGAVSRWRLELSPMFPQFDYETISDVILQLRYTARDGGVGLKNAAIQALKATLADDTGVPLSRLFSLRHEFPGEWQKLIHAPASSEADPVMRSSNLALVKNRFPFYLAAATLQGKAVIAVAVPKIGGMLPAFTLSLTTPPGGSNLPVDLALQPHSSFGNALFAQSPEGVALPEIENDPTKLWQVGLTLDKNAMQTLSENLQDVFLVVRYVATLSP
jgi:Tc toxin complex TcA C-terminal TcB-binding domain/Neuraminidase-like domain